MENAAYVDSDLFAKAEREAYEMMPYYIAYMDKDEYIANYIRYNSKQHSSKKKKTASQT